MDKLLFVLASAGGVYAVMAYVIATVRKKYARIDARKSKQRTKSEMDKNADEFIKAAMTSSKKPGLFDGKIIGAFENKDAEDDLQHFINYNKKNKRR